MPGEIGWNRGWGCSGFYCIVGGYTFYFFPDFIGRWGEDGENVVSVTPYIIGLQG
ncbi:MAG: hypothetical protein JW904_15145 [Spirochaetales bacterium]|nr:hypothetical protein [Spirochaetales bacterium]